MSNAASNSCALVTKYHITIDGSMPASAATARIVVRS